MKFRKLRVMPAWVHVAFWVASVVLALGLVVTGLAGLSATAAGVPPPDPRNTQYFVGFAITLAGVWLVWRQYWFLPGDLAALLRARGGRAERSRSSRRTIRGRVADFWVLGSLDRPVRGYWPARMFRITRGGLVPRYGLKPEYMLRAARLEVVRVGDFSGLPRTTIGTTAGALAAGTDSPHDAGLDQALREAAAALSEPDMPVAVEIAASWLRVETSGGSWLGARFARRIEELLAFADRLLRSLAGRFTLGDPDAWLVEREREELQVYEAPATQEGRREIES